MKRGRKRRKRRKIKLLPSQQKAKRRKLQEAKITTRCLRRE